MMKNPQDVLEQWILSVNSGNVEGLLGLYDSQAVLIPTFSNQIYSTAGKLREYFDRLGSRKELSVAVHEKTLINQVLEDEVFVLSGIYNWCFSEDGEPLKFEARFSYVMDLSKPAPILHHHSSQVPRSL